VARNTLGDLLAPYNPSSDLSRLEQSTAPTDLGGASRVIGTQHVDGSGGTIGAVAGYALGGPITAGIGYLAGNAADDGQDIETVQVDPTLNKDYYTGKYYGLNNPATINRGQSFSDLVPGRETTFNQSLNSLSAAEDQGFGNDSNPENFYKDIQLNPVGKLALISRLQQSFGPNYATDPRAQNILNSFHEAMNEGQDLDKLASLIDSGAQVNDYLAQNQYSNMGGTYKRVKSG
jgi:hypothetical protein